ncbi:MAG: hypothetical protein ACIAXF_04575 [Phycisphaerales bacterium JB063]
MPQDPYPTDPPREPDFSAPAMPYAPPAGMAADPNHKVAEHVRLLGILTWVYAGLELLGVLLGLLYAGIGLFLVANPPAELVQQYQNDPNAMPPTMFGWIFFGVGALVLLFTGTLTLLTVMTALDLMRHRRRVFCMVIAGLHCINLPLGTVLGIFTIIVLSKPEAKSLFDRGNDEA